jgi:hypothetical protein
VRRRDCRSSGGWRRGRLNVLGYLHVEVSINGNPDRRSIRNEKLAGGGRGQAVAPPSIGCRKIS